MWDVKHALLICTIPVVQNFTYCHQWATNIASAKYDARESVFLQKILRHLPRGVLLFLSLN